MRLCPSMRLDDKICNYSEWILFGLHVITVQSALPLARMLSKMRTDTPFWCPSITFQTCVIRRPEG